MVKLNDSAIKETRSDIVTPAEDSVDRIVLQAKEGQILERWVTELNQRFDGMLRLTKSDLANFVIREHAANLSEDEIAAIELEFYDDLRWLNWAQGKIRKAKKEGVSLTLEDLMLKRTQRKPVHRLAPV